MKLHKRLLLWLNIRVVMVMGWERYSMLIREYPWFSRTVLKLAGYINEQPTRYRTSGKQLNRAMELRDMTVRHFNALVEEDAPSNRAAKVHEICVLAQQELDAALEADRLNLLLEASDWEERGP